jgi:HNH endonuclease
MRIELIIFFVTSAILVHIYTDGQYTKRILAAKKQLQMAGVVLGALFLYYLIRKNPLKAKDLILTSNEYIKYLPVDKNTSDFISPILDFTAKNTYGSMSAGGHNTVHVYERPQQQQYQQQTNRMMQSGKKGTKRSVSETKKKFVASRQNWRCGHCDKQLTAWFEVDHKVRLEHGGSNHIDNLVALCRECHGEKTTIENL